MKNKKKMREREENFVFSKFSLTLLLPLFLSGDFVGFIFYVLCISYCFAFRASAGLCVRENLNNEKQ
jgi:hypothetical protein